MLVHILSGMPAEEGIPSHLVEPLPAPDSVPVSAVGAGEATHDRTRGSPSCSLADGPAICARRLRSRRASLSILTSLLQPLPVSSLLPKNSSPFRRPLPILKPLYELPLLLTKSNSGGTLHGRSNQTSDANGGDMADILNALRSHGRQDESHQLLSASKADPLPVKGMVHAFAPFSLRNASQQHTPNPAAGASVMPSSDSSRTPTISWSPFALQHPHFDDGGRRGSSLIPLAMSSSPPEISSPRATLKRSASIATLLQSSGLGQCLASMAPWLSPRSSSSQVPLVSDPTHPLVLQPSVNLLTSVPLQLPAITHTVSHSLHAAETQPTDLKRKSLGSSLTTRRSLPSATALSNSHCSSPQAVCAIWDEARLHTQTGSSRNSGINSSSASLVQQGLIFSRLRSSIHLGLQTGVASEPRSPQRQETHDGEYSLGPQHLAHPRCIRRSATHPLGYSAAVTV